MKTLIRNPFVLTPYVPEEYFCDREKETAQLCKHILNGRNVALFANRRLGKTGLIRHCFQKKEIKESFHTFLVDIYSAGSLKEMASLFAKAVFSSSGVSGLRERLVLRARKGLFSIPEDSWRELAAPGSDITVTVAVREEGGLVARKPFSIRVSEDRIEPYVAYRLIDPGYETWNKLGLYQRCLEDFTETPIMTNDETGRNCMNCHSFLNRDPGTMMFHMRSTNGGTYVWKDGAIEKLNTKTPQTISALVYPYWHPSGKYIAFSVNDIAQFFHSTDPNRIEVYDYKSDVVVYDVENHQVSTSPMLTDTTRMETFPSFSPDGKTLYYCSTRQPRMPQGYKDVRYSICSIPFSQETFSFGDKVDTLYYASKTGLDATFPRVSPDGRFLLFAETAIGPWDI